MVNAQEWLDKEYPKEQRNKTTEINAKNQDLEGKLTIKDFPDLRKIECGNNKVLTGIEIINLPKLDYFHANNCQLDDLTIENCPQITYFNVANNFLYNTGFLDNLNLENLSILSIHSNNFSEQTLESFSKFINLQQLYLDNCDKAKFRKGHYNRFTGSLKPLQNLTKLEILSIGKTDIDSGLEYLPKSLRKIGFNFAIKVETGCSKLRQELEEASKIEGITEKLQQQESGDPTWISDYYRIAPWRQALNLVGEEELRKQNTRQWLDQNYPKEQRGGIVFLTINDKGLKGHLNLKDFYNLEKLDCSDNKITDLDLSKCSRLTHLYCDNNSFSNLNFLKTLPHPKKLKEIYLGDNEKLLSQNLNFLIPFAGLLELNLENCSFRGSLKPLKIMGRLERIYISNTDIDDGLDDLPESCQRVYCVTNQVNKKSMTIVRQLNSYSEELFDENIKAKKYYNLAKWRENKQNSTIALVIPLERLFVIRSNIKKFVDKWGVKEGESNKNNLSELSKLKHPDEFSKSWWLIGGMQWTNRATSVVGGSLLLVGQSDTANPNSQIYSQTGGVIAIVAPFVETITSYINDKIYDTKQKQWDEFIDDTKNLLDNYHELLGIIEAIEINKFGEINKVLKKLDEVADSFLAKYDDDKNGVIDILELIEGENRKDFAQDLDRKEKSKLNTIVETMKKLEEAITKYRQGLTNEVNTEVKSKVKRLEGGNSNALLGLNEQESKSVEEFGNRQQVQEEIKKEAVIEVMPTPSTSKGY